MTFISLNFILLMFVSFILYFIVPIKIRWIILLLTSAGFYVMSGIENVPFLLAALIISYGAGIIINGIYEKQERLFSEREFTKDEKKDIQIKNKKKCKRICLASIMGILLLLVYSKTGKWIVDSIYSWLSVKGTGSFVAPLGISYYTFSTVGYIADVYWRKEKAEQNIFKYALFVLYFPKILQGPISRHKYLAPQLIEGHKLEYTRFCYGMQLMIWGYFKKLVIADRVGIFVGKAFTNYQTYSGGILLVAVLFSAIQLYCDFSGCMDIASGISQIFGIQLEKNFNHPFFSKSAAEFWRRWHITLGAWFKDYVYMPLVISPKLAKIVQKVKAKGNERLAKSLMTIIPLAVVWILTGVWHGTGLSYVIWGVYWGVIIIISTVFEKEIKRVNEKLGINTASFSWKLFQMIRTFLLFCIGRIITVPNNLKATGEIIKRIFTKFEIWTLLDGSLYKLGLDKVNFQLALVAIVLLWLISFLQEKGCVRDMIASRNIVLRWTIYFAAIFSVMIFGIYGPGYEASAFAYMNF